MSIHFPLIAVACVTLSTAARAQNFNVDAGSVSSGLGVPSPSYGGAALQPGTWNAWNPSSIPVALLDVTGAPTSVTLKGPSFGSGVENNPGTFGDDEALLDDYQDLGPIGSGHIWTFSGLLSGRYALYTYAWPGEDGDVDAVGGVSLVCGGTPDAEQVVGGAWPGQNALGVTYAVHHLDVPSEGSFCIEVRSISGHAQLNGFQLVRQGPAQAPVYCAGDGSATPCPCANAGLLGRGCANSSDARGASLWPTGQASIANDYVYLYAQWMPNGGSMLVQGTAQLAGGQGAVFGDGLFCVGGSLLRLGAHINSGGESRWPQGAELPISFAGSAGVGAVRHYQVWYRDAPAFCSSDTFNLTNAVTISWQP